jgi:hypothetical protein
MEVELTNEQKYRNIFMSEEHSPYINNHSANIVLIDQNRNSMPNLISEINESYLAKFKKN